MELLALALLFAVFAALWRWAATHDGGHLNVAVFLYTRGWHLKPRLTYSRWFVRSMRGKVWYVNFQWLWFGFQIDNEW